MDMEGIIKECQQHAPANPALRMILLRNAVNEAAQEQDPRMLVSVWEDEKGGYDILIRPVGMGWAK